MTKKQEIVKVDPESNWYIDYTCPHCGQLGTARFSGKDMKFIANDEYLVSKKTIYCCQCRKSGVEIEEVAEY